MKKIKHSKTVSPDRLAVGLGLLALVAATLILARAEARETVKIDGSSTVYPITEAVAEEFQKEKKGKVVVTVGISGTGGGFKKFCRGGVHISGASRPIKTEEHGACQAAGIEFIEIPVAFDALTVIVNPVNSWASSMTVAELKKIWGPEAQGTLTRWSQVNPQWPDAPLTLYGPGADSGTFDYFTEAVVGKSASSRGDYTASEDDNVLVQGVATDKNALGYLGFAYYAENRSRLKAVAIDGGNGPVAPSPTTVENGSYAPLSRPVFIYVSKQALGNPAVREFVEFYLAQTPKLVPQVKYVPLSSKAYALAAQRLKEQKTGTVFASAKPGLAIERLLQNATK